MTIARRLIAQCMLGAALTLFATAVPALAREAAPEDLVTAPPRPAPLALVAQADIDFGDDSSPWANDGECDDPRFEGPGTAAELVEDDLGRDATDCRTLFEEGSITLVGGEAGEADDAGAIDFGDDSSEWANDGECDDPRFTGRGMATELVEEDTRRDATDCRTLFEAGSITLRDAGGADAAGIDFGDDSSPWANDGECDDPRFTGRGMAAELVDEDIRRDASDCRTLFEEGSITLVGGEAGDGDAGAGAEASDIDFGDDSSPWANDGECDDPRFEGRGMASVPVDDDRLRDATDCRTLFEAGSITLKSDAGSGADDASSSGIDFGDDSSRWANDGECDDPRFEGVGMASSPVAEDRMRDATDCREAYEAGTVTLRGEASVGDFDFGDDSSRWAHDGECDDRRFTGPGTNKKLLPEDERADASDCRALLEAGQVEIRKVYDPAYAAGAPYDSAGIEFGNNTSSYANDGECDDPRFEGPGTAYTLLESDEFRDANDCRAAFEAGTVVLREDR